VNSSTALTIAFIEKRPLAAGRVLAGMDPADAAAFLDTIPTRTAAKVVERLGAWPSSSIVTRMNQAGAATLLRQVPFRDAAAILRLVPAEMRAPLMADLPARLQRAFESSLSFGENTVGAQMTTAIVAIDGHLTAGDVREQLVRAPDAEADVVFVVDGDRRFLGAVSSAALLRRNATVTLGELMDETVTCLSARARLSSVADLDAWDEYVYLPVVDRQGSLIGALPRKAIREADEAASTGAGGRSSIAASMAEAFMVSVAELVELLTEGAPPSYGSGSDRS
jgi:magnesium transporter